MKRFLFVFATLLMVSLSLSAGVDPLDKNNERPVIINGSTQHPNVSAPTGVYYTDTHILTICFPAIGFSNYTIEVSSMYASLEYYIYTPTAQFNLSQMLEEQVDLVIYTDDGDLYWATVDTTVPDEPMD